jgi:hypothetical protein
MKLWPWSRFAEDARQMRGLADQLQASSAVNQDLMHKLQTARKDGARINEHNIGLMTELANVRLDLAHIRGKLVTCQYERDAARGMYKPAPNRVSPVPPNWNSLVGGEQP